MYVSYINMYYVYICTFYMYFIYVSIHMYLYMCVCVCITHMYIYFFFFFSFLFFFAASIRPHLYFEKRKMSVYVIKVDMWPALFPVISYSKNKREALPRDTLHLTFWWGLLYIRGVVGDPNDFYQQLP